MLLFPSRQIIISSSIIIILPYTMFCSRQYSQLKEEKKNTDFVSINTCPSATTFHAKQEPTHQVSYSHYSKNMTESGIVLLN